MSRKEMEDSKHFTSQAKKTPYKKNKTVFLDGINVEKIADEDKPVEIYYEVGGRQTENVMKAMAKKVVHANEKREYFIKQATAGTGVGRFLNPWGPTYNVGDEYKFEKHMGRYRYVFKQVNPEIFDMYIKFLETRNERHLLNAEREFSNG